MTHVVSHDMKSTKIVFKYIKVVYTQNGFRSNSYTHKCSSFNRAILEIVIPNLMQKGYENSFVD